MAEEVEQEASDISEKHVFYAPGTRLRMPNGVWYTLVEGKGWQLDDNVHLRQDE